MNTDPNEVVVFLSDGLSRLSACFIRIGASDNGKEFMDNATFEKMMQEGIEFLCADSHLSLESRKAAWNFQINQITSYLERSVLAPTSKDTLLKKLKKSTDDNFVSECTKRAELIEKVMQTSVTKMANETSTVSLRSSI